MSIRRKWFEVTKEGNHLFRPWGNFGGTYELPDKKSHDRAKMIVYGLMIVLIAVIAINLFARLFWITIVAALVILATLLIWIYLNKPKWTRFD